MSPSSAAAGSPTLRQLLRGRTLVTLSVLAVGLLLTELDQSVFATALPTIVGELGGLDRQLWVGTGYVLAAVVTMPLIGRLGDLVGRRTVFTVALGLFVLGSLIGALAPSMSVLIAARVLQGLGGGGLLILVEAVIAELVPPAQRTLVLSGVGAVFAVASVAGPLLGGMLTDTVGWRWAFWLNVPLGAVAALLAWRCLPADPGRRATGRTARIDWAGIGCLTVAVTAGLLAVVRAGDPAGERGWTSPLVLGLAGLALAAVAVLVRVERSALEPVFPPALFRNPTFVGAVLAGGVMAVAMFGAINYLPSYLQMVYGLSATSAGLFLLTLVGGIGAATVLAGRVVSRTGRPLVFPILGALLAGTALWLGGQWRADTSLVAVGGCLVLLGAGIGCAWEVLVVVVQDVAPARDLGSATAVNGFVRELGVLLGTALVGKLFTSRLLGQLTGLNAPSASSTTALTPDALARLDPATRAGVAQAYNEALTPVLGWAAPLLLAAALGLLCVPRRRLGGTRIAAARRPQSSAGGSRS